MPYNREGNTWDIINPFIELGQELTSVRIWGQTVKWGMSWGGYLNQNLYAQGTNTDAIYSLGEGLSLIDAIITLNDGEVPETSVTYLFGVNGPVTTWAEATFAIGWWYYGVEPYCYCEIGAAGLMTQAGFENSFNYLASVLSSRCGVHGFNPLNITDADRAIFTAYFCTASVTNDDSRHPTMPESAIKVWQVGGQYNTNRSSEPTYLLTNHGHLYVDNNVEYYLPDRDADDPTASHLYFKYGRDFTIGWRFPADLAEDLYDFYEDMIEEDQIGGEGDYFIDGDSLGMPPIPKIGIMESGMVKLYLPTPLDLKTFARELWTDNASIAAAFGAMVNSPIEAVVNLGLLPLNLSSFRDSAVQVQMGSYTMTTTMNPAIDEFYPFDFGSILIPEKWQSALDFSPYCKLSLYLPYVGYVDLPPEEVLGRYISVVYYINLFTGDFVSWVLTSYGSKTNPLFQFTGNCMFKMPITALDYSAYYKNQHDLFAGAMSSFASGNVLGGVIDSVAFAAGCAQPAANVRRNGEFSGSTAIMAYPQPFVIRTTARQVFQGSRQDSSGFDKYSGFPCYKILKLYEGMGYVKINDMIMDGFTLNDEEEKELRRLLQEGVYL